MITKIDLSVNKLTEQKIAKKAKQDENVAMTLAQNIFSLEKNFERFDIVSNIKNSYYKVLMLKHYFRKSIDGVSIANYCNPMKTPNIVNPAIAFSIINGTIDIEKADLNLTLNKDLQSEITRFVKNNSDKYIAIFADALFMPVMALPNYKDGSDDAVVSNTSKAGINTKFSSEYIYLGSNLKINQYVMSNDIQLSPDDITKGTDVDYEALGNFKQDLTELLNNPEIGTKYHTIIFNSIVIGNLTVRSYSSSENMKIGHFENQIKKFLNFSVLNAVNEQNNATEFVSSKLSI